jgi:hypothetical protein
MKPSLLPTENLKTHFWYPYNLRIRWVVALIGIAGLGFSLWDYFHGQKFNLGRFGQGLLFCAISLQKPQLRPKDWVTNASSILMSALTFAVIAVCIFVLIQKTN